MINGIIIWIIFNGLGFLLLSRFFKAHQKSKVAQNWPTTTGTVLESEMDDDTTRNAVGKVEVSLVITVVYEYSVAGQTYKGDKVTFGRPAFSYITATNIHEQFAVGKQVPVYYNPAVPSESVLAPKSTAGMPSWIPGVFLIAVGIFVGLFSIFKNS